MKANWPACLHLIQKRHARRWAKIAVFLFTALPLLRSQDIPRAQLFGGYSYLNFDSRSFGFANRSSLNGYTVSPAFNITYGLGVVAEVSGQYGSRMNFRDVTIGPQFVYGRGNLVFSGHALFGSTRSFVNVGGGERDRERGVLLGGAVDLGISSRFAVRVFQADYVRSTLFDGKQNSVRISTGLVYRWHSIKRKRRPITAP
ncbi:MAG TPA: hypothetical protein VGL91_20025 [Acidobacteriota bacterium]|jgi:hypothetical protein